MVSDEREPETPYDPTAYRRILGLLDGCSAEELQRLKAEAVPQAWRRLRTVQRYQDTKEVAG